MFMQSIRVKRFISLCSAVILGISLVACSPTNGGNNNVFNSDQRVQPLHNDWKFSLQEEEAYAVDYDDSSWQVIQLPHDYSINQDYSIENEAESGFLPGGTGWYRKSFVLSQEDEGEQVRVFFSGIYKDASIYLNGELLGTHPYGYTKFGFDISDLVITDGETENILAVKVENTIPNSRWYTGSGIEREVILYVSEPSYLDEESLYVTTDQLEAQQNGFVDTLVEVPVINNEEQGQSFVVQAQILDKDGNAVSEKVASDININGNTDALASVSIPVDTPQLWSPDNPVLYTTVVQLWRDDILIDQVETSFGYRYFSFDVEDGFSLNGQSTKIKGVCMHVDQGPLGAVDNVDAIARQLQKLKDMGVNAIRISHHPASDFWLDLCDEMGFLVIEEAFDTWTLPKNANWNDYSLNFQQYIDTSNNIIYGDSNMTWAQFDIQSMVRDSRNAPSVILYSIGNEILGNISGDTSEYPQIAGMLCDWIQELDTQRPITIGDNRIMFDDPTQIAMDQQIIDHGGIIGLNYATAQQYDYLHTQYPDWVFYASETASVETTRSWYSTTGIDNTNYQVSSFGNTYPEWGTRASTAWQDANNRQYIAGEFVWTGFDYLGEPEPWNGLGAGSVTSGQQLSKSSYFGQIDTAGFEKDSYYYYQSQWNDNVTTLHILPNWNEEDIIIDYNNQVQVTVYSDAPSVECFLNDVSQGIQTSDTGIYNFLVSYEPGTLRVVAYDSGGNLINETVGRSQVVTYTQAVTTNIIHECSSLLADGNSLCYVEIDVVDEQDNLVYNADQSLDISVEGEATIVGVDNGNPTDITPYQPITDTQASKQVFRGKMILILQSTNVAGEITINVSSEGLENSSYTLSSQ